MKIRRIMCFIASALLCSSSSIAQSENPSSVATLPNTETVSIPELTIVEIEILDPLNSKTSKIGDFFDIRSTEAVIIGDKTVIPAGSMGKGEVIHSAKARAAGKAGELILMARYLDSNGVRIPLRSFKYGASTGKSKVGEAFAVGVVVATPLILFVSGGNVDIPAGTRAHAKTSAEIKLPITGENK